MIAENTEGGCKVSCSLCLASSHVTRSEGCRGEGTHLARLRVHVHSTAHAQAGGLAVERVTVAAAGDRIQAHTMWHFLALAVYLGALREWRSLLHDEKHSCRETLSVGIKGLFQHARSRLAWVVQAGR
jgi:hypothetical protein